MVSIYSSLYVPLIRKSLKWKTPELVEDSNEPIHDDLPAILPEFQPDWEWEFLETDYQPRPVLATCCVGAVFFSVSFFLGYFGTGVRAAGGTRDWIALTWGPHLLCSLLSAALMRITYLHAAHRLLVRHYNPLCLFLTVFFYLNLVWYNLIREVRRSLFQYSETPQITWHIDFSGPLPVRTCNDSDPVATWQNWPLPGSAVGCNNLILSGNIFAFYALVNMLPAILRMRPLPALAATLTNTLILVAAVLAVGTRSWVLLSAVLFQLATGLSAAYMCRVRQRLAREQFAVAKSTTGAARQNRKLLHTLIPKNVLSRLASHDASGGEMLGTTISECTIMFCSLEPQAELQAAFSEELFTFLNAVFCTFDDAVTRFEMFKYQHVGDLYIVACPRAAKPFDEAEQGAPYPDAYARSMLLLADTLKTLAKRFRFGDDLALSLKVGISHGDAAGAVIGFLLLPLRRHGQHGGAHVQVRGPGPDPLHRGLRGVRAAAGRGVDPVRVAGDDGDQGQ
eukprot:CAMPEP_0172172290 /NCGR_PEP_ID=MMETSP1050-20130122/12361_1 /TAXON_ID=233186 /ORGANISM="Cryptomonas curvata, Strain CCAP979/52" /LENGTH=507 /DNA_ID=CAMNT_0012843807 /DNA_START=379 /DNA_END=1899 /DNA_ORIENTATION=+